MISLLHLCDSLFPIGSFAYSDGLESAASRGTVTRTAELADWLSVCLDESIGRCDGPAIVAARSTVERGDWDKLAAIDEEVMALRPSSASRTANRSMGLRLLKTWQAVYPDTRLEHAIELARLGRLAPALPIAFSLACFCQPTPARVEDALAAYAYTRLAAGASAAMRLMPLGQMEAHQLLGRLLRRVPRVVEAVMASGEAPGSFAPALDIAQITQPYVESRLFRS